MSDNIYTNSKKLFDKIASGEEKVNKVRKKKSYSCLGIDACKGKWVAVHISQDGFYVGKFNTIGDICIKFPDCDIYIIDIPIGLPDHKKHKRPESFARKELRGKGSTIFEVPCRQAVYSGSKEAARKANIEILGKSLSCQSICISKAIRQVDEFLLTNPIWKNRILESHPEFCFSKLNHLEDELGNKKTPEGMLKRLSVLEKYYSEAPKVVDKFLEDVPYRKKTDDVVDALCLAITGKEILKRGLKTIPNNPMGDNRGIYMQMVYAESY